MKSCLKTTEVNPMCELLLSSIIVGAIEFNWGSMRIEYFVPGTSDQIETIYVYTDDYLACLERPPVEEPTEA